MSEGNTRLLLRKYLEADRADFVRLNADPMVRKHMNGVLSSARASQVFDRVMLSEFTFAIVKKDTGEYVGHIFTSETESPEEREIGFLLFQEFWGKGFASEAGKILIGNLLANSKVAWLTATVDVGHESSSKVLEKLGFHFFSSESDDRGLYLVYKKHLIS